LRRRSRAIRAALPAVVYTGTGDARILGLDPGSLVTGYAVIDCDPRGTRFVASGGIRTNGAVFAERLRQIYAGVAAVIAEFAPGEVAVERVFMHRNADSALKLGQARGAALCATFGSEMRVYEYAPREVKRAVVGTGAAEKAQVQMMVTRILGLDRQPAADAADALAIALCHAHARTATTLVAAAGRRWR